MKPVDPEDAIVAMLITAFGVWSVLAVSSLPAAITPPSVNDGAVSVRESTPPSPVTLAPSPPVVFNSGRFFSKGQSRWNLQALEPVLLEAISIGYFPVDPKEVISSLLRPSGYMTLILASDSRNYQALSVQVEGLRSVCQSSSIHCLMLVSDPNDASMVQVEYLSRTNFSTFLVNPSALAPLLSDSSIWTERDSPATIQAMLFGGEGDLFWASAVFEARDIYLVTRTALAAARDPNFLGAPQVSVPPVASKPENVEPQQIEDKLEASADTKVGRNESEVSVKSAASAPEEANKEKTPKPQSKDQGVNTKGEAKSSKNNVSDKLGNVREEDNLDQVGPDQKAVRLASLPYAIYNVKDGTPTKLTGWVAKQKRPVLISFWATWCTPCRHELPLLSQLSKDNKQILFVGLVDGDPTPQTYKEVAKLLSQAGAEFPQYIIPESKLQVDLTGGRAMPAFAAFDAKGRFMGSFVGSISKEKDLARFKEFLHSMSRESK